MKAMKKDFFDDTFLARWMDGTLTKEEAIQFEKEPEYSKYVQIKKASNQLSFSDYDVNNAFDTFRSKHFTKKTSKVIPLYKYLGAIAATAILLFGFLFFYNSPNNYKTEIANTETILLPDGSEMQLQANSLAKVAKNWEKDRSLNLQGEAFFKVKKGEKFSVNTSLGKVQVLGTQFSVTNYNENLFTVKCFEGKVRVITPEKTLILTKGNAYQWTNTNSITWKFNETKPSWISKSEITFNKVPLYLVAQSLENHYSIKIINSENIPVSNLFTGNYTTTDLNTALYTIFSTAGLKYKISKSNEVHILR